MKPTLAPPDNPRVTALPFYGYDPALQVDPAKAPPKQYDILHVGHNWWRWKEVAGELLPAFEQIRDQVGEIGFVGLWWDRPPVEGPEAGPGRSVPVGPGGVPAAAHPHHGCRDVHRRDPHHEHRARSTSSRSAPCCTT